jgi:outer membrane receptor for ferrienterochelin and colicins
MKKIFTFFAVLYTGAVLAQSHRVEGRLKDDRGNPVPFAAVALLNTTYGTGSAADGSFQISGVPEGNYRLAITALGYEPYTIRLEVPVKKALELVLNRQESELGEVVVTGTMKEVSKDDSPVNIDIITPKLFRKTPTPSLFEAAGLVNGVKPQINCNVCNTGDIHINGLEGPYTLILIDGMPIVSGLSTVYGLMGVPTGMIERLEIAKGPAAALYGSEAMGGTINLITKKPAGAPRLYLDYYGTSYLENNLDLSTRLKLGKRTDWLIGANGYLYDRPVDINNDGFTDVTLQKRVSLFNKIAIQRKDDRELTIAGRYVYEDRWGGQMNWDKRFRGGDSIYGESIYVRRAELISKYQWPVKEKIFTQLSYNFHDQNSVYGETYFLARQSTAFAQTYWTRQLNTRNEFLAGLTYKNLWFDDNTVITQSADGSVNQPENTHTTGLFLQNETRLDSAARHRLLLGARLDYNNRYRFIPSPRLAYKWTPHHRFTARLNFGTGFRIVNVFTEDHAALTGAREVVFVDRIRPERSYNGSLNLVYKMKLAKTSLITWDAGLFYYHFTNKIYANYDEDPNKVIYNNLDGYAFSRGGSLSASLASPGNLKFILGVTYADVQNISRDSTGHHAASWQLQSPRWSGNIIVGYELPRLHSRIDLTGNWYGPQRLPVLPADYRPEFSPWFCLLNLQVSRTVKDLLEVYAGVKNLLNFIPRDPIMRPHDPFDKTAGDQASNPNGYTFDPSYNYAPIQGIRAYLGLRMTLK